MARELSSDEFRVLRSAFLASDLDGDGTISKADLQASYGLHDEENVDSLFEALKNDTEAITFEDFARGAIDFPFLLEGFRVEVEDRRSEEALRRSSGNAVIRIDTIEEDTNEDLSPMCASPNELFSEVKEGETSSPPLLAQAYCIFKSLLRQSEQSASEESVEKLRDVLTQLKTQVPDGESDADIRRALVEGSQLLLDHLEASVSALTSALNEYKHANEVLTNENSALKRRCEMTDIRNTLLFDKIKRLESDMNDEQKRQESILLESSSMQELLQFTRRQGPEQLQELSAIQIEIAKKEVQIGQLQQEVRRLISRRVLQELSPIEDSAAAEVRSLRREKHRSGKSLEQMPQEFSPTSSPVDSPRHNRSRSLFHSNFSHRRVIQDWEAQLRGRDVDLTACTERSLTEMSDSKLRLGKHRSISEIPLESVELPKIEMQTVLVADIPPHRKTKSGNRTRGECCPTF